MKKNYIFLTAILILVISNSCKNEYIWEEEQYEQYVSFKAPMNDNGCTPIYIRYKPEGEVTYKLPIIISGSTMNDKTRHIHIAEDQDTVAVINEQRFGPNRPEWWYEPLEKGKFYDFDEELVMDAGCSLSTLDIKFNLAGIDMTRKWVVPLTIMDDPSYDYKKHPRKNYAKAVLRVWPFNDYSGNYSTTTMEVYLWNRDTQKTDGIAMVTNERRAYVVDENTVFFYAGLMNEEMTVENKEKYKIFVRFLGHGSEDEGDFKLQVWANKPEEIGFELKSKNMSYQVASIPDVNKPYLEHRYVNFDLEYIFDDVTSAKDKDGNPVHIPYYVKGSLIMQRDINTQIPDEDQAIQW